MDLSLSIDHRRFRCAIDSSECTIDREACVPDLRGLRGHYPDLNMVASFVRLDITQWHKNGSFRRVFDTPADNPAIKPKPCSHGLDWLTLVTIILVYVGVRSYKSIDFNPVLDHRNHGHLDSNLIQ